MAKHTLKILRCSQEEKIMVKQQFQSALSRSSGSHVLQNRCLLKFHKFHGKTTVALKPVTLLKRDANTGVFL